MQELAEELKEEGETNPDVSLLSAKGPEGRGVWNVGRWSEVGHLAKMGTTDAVDNILCGHSYAASAQRVEINLARDWRVLWECGREKKLVSKL